MNNGKQKGKGMNMKSIDRQLFYAIFINMCILFFFSCGGGGSDGSGSPSVDKPVTDPANQRSIDEQVASIDEADEKGGSEIHYKMAFILLTLETDSASVIEERLNALTTVKENFSDGFYWATRRHAFMDTSYDVIPMSIQLGDVNGIASHTDLFKEFYETHPDDFDFISIFHESGLSYRMYHQNIKNNIEGIGLREFDYSGSYGSEGKLLGINVIPYIPSTVDEMEILSVNALLHETGHQWGVYIGENFKNDPDIPVEIKQQNIHFYRGLESQNLTGTPMGSDRWVPNGDGTYRRENLSNIHQEYHPIQLYFMGILHKGNYDFNTVFKVFNAGGGDSILPFDPENAVLYKEITINDIIDFEGERGYF